MKNIADARAERVLKHAVLSIRSDARAEPRLRLGSIARSSVYAMNICLFFAQKYT